MLAAGCGDVEPRRAVAHEGPSAEDWRALQSTLARLAAAVEGRTTESELIDPRGERRAASEGLGPEGVAAVLERLDRLEAAVAGLATGEVGAAARALPELARTPRQLRWEGLVRSRPALDAGAVRAFVLRHGQLLVDQEALPEELWFYRPEDVIADLGWPSEMSRGDDWWSLVYAPEGLAIPWDESIIGGLSFEFRAGELVGLNAFEPD